MVRLALASLLVSVAVCNRAPEEPARVIEIAAQPPIAKPDVAAPTAAAAPARSTARCLLPTPSAPPPLAAPALRCPADPAGGPPKAPVASLHFLDAPATPLLEVELARTPEENARGLMYRTKMAADHGMFFALGSHEDLAFWMLNTCISLDMLFVESDGTIVGLLENVPTLDDDPRSVGCASSYVIETNAGWCRQHGIKAGQRVELPRL